MYAQNMIALFSLVPPFILSFCHVGCCILSQSSQIAVKMWKKLFSTKLAGNDIDIFLHTRNLTYFLLYSFSYVVYCGLVFVALSQPYMMHQYGKDWGHKAPIRLCDRILYGVQGTKEQEVVILSQVGGFFAFMPFQYFFTFIDTVKNACFRFYALMVSVK